MPGMEVFVLSRTMSQEDCPGVTVSDDPAGVVAQLQASSGKDLWLFGGGSLFGSMLELGLVDTVEVAIMPVLLGDGIPLLTPHPALAKLDLKNHTVYGKTGTVILEYSITRGDD